MYVCMYRLEAWVTLLYNISLCNNFQYTIAQSIARDFTLQAFVNCEQNIFVHSWRVPKCPVFTMLLTLLSLSMAYINEPQIR